MQTKPAMFEVLRVDSDGTVQLTNITMEEKGIKNTTVWALTSAPLVKGECLAGTFDFDPKDSLLFGFPTFTPVVWNKKYGHPDPNVRLRALIEWQHSDDYEDIG